MKYLKLLSYCFLGLNLCIGNDFSHSTHMIFYNNARGLSTEKNELDFPVANRRDE